MEISWFGSLIFFEVSSTFLILPDLCPNILFPLLNAPWTCPLGNPFISCTHLGHTSLQLQTLFWWFFVGRSGDMYNSKTHGKAQPGLESLEIVNRAGIVCAVGTQPWLSLKGLQQLTCSHLGSIFDRRSADITDRTHMCPATFSRWYLQANFLSSRFVGNIL